MPLALIVGAGIGGLAAGNALRREGWDVRIFERAATPREIGFGVGLAPNAMASLRELGVADAVIAQGVVPTSGELRRVDGRVLRRFVGSADRPAAPSATRDLTRVVLRPALHGALLDALPVGTVRVNAAAVKYVIDGARVRLELANGTMETGDVLIGADGIGSAIRAGLHPAEASPRPSGYFAIRGVSRALGGMEGLHAIWYFGRGTESGLVLAGSGSIYWFVSLFADDVRRGPADVTSVFRRCTAHFDPKFHAITGEAAPADMRLDELFVRDHLAHWGTGPVTLLGDAAHPMLPFTGQGAAQALEDAVGLGRALRGSTDHVAALRRYEAVRMPRTRRVVNTGPRIARVTTTRSRIIGALRNAAIRLVPESAILKAFKAVGPDPNRALGEP